LPRLQLPLLVGIRRHELLCLSCAVDYRSKLAHSVLIHSKGLQVAIRKSASRDLVLECKERSRLRHGRLLDRRLPRRRHGERGFSSSAGVGEWRLVKEVL
jgi:hypothetical protein